MRARSFPYRLASAAALLVLALACSSEPAAEGNDVCEPGKEYYCRCKNLDEGSQFCRADGKGYAPYERGICPTYNQYKYGTDKLPAYAGESDDSRLFVRYAARDVVYLLGGADNNPEHRLLDKACGAEAQGATRLARGTGYVQYEHVLAARGSKPVPLRHSAFEVGGVGHDGKRMFGSVCGVRALLGGDAPASNTAAACDIIKPRGK